MFRSANKGAEVLNLNLLQATMDNLETGYIKIGNDNGFPFLLRKYLLGKYR